MECSNSKGELLKRTIIHHGQTGRKKFRLQSREPWCPNYPRGNECSGVLRRPLRWLITLAWKSGSLESDRQHWQNMIALSVNTHTVRMVMETILLRSVHAGKVSLFCYHRGCWFTLALKPSSLYLQCIFNNRMNHCCYYLVHHYRHMTSHRCNTRIRPKNDH